MSGEIRGLSALDMILTSKILVDDNIGLICVLCVLFCVSFWLCIKSGLAAASNERNVFFKVIKSLVSFIYLL